MNKFFIKFLLLIMLSVNQSFAQLDQRAHVLDELELVGSAEFQFLFWKIYEAELYSPDGEYSGFEALPVALKLSYRKAFSADHLLSETERQFMALGLDRSRYEAWLQQLSDIFVGVKPGDELLLYLDGEGFSHFYFNTTYLGSIENSEFSQQFSAIWLAREDRYASFSQRLTGGGV